MSQDGANELQALHGYKSVRHDEPLISHGNHIEHVINSNHSTESQAKEAGESISYPFTCVRLQQALVEVLLYSMLEFCEQIIDTCLFWQRNRQGWNLRRSRTQVWLKFVHFVIC